MFVTPHPALVSIPDAVHLSGAAELETTVGAAIPFEEIYDDHVEFVWRVLRRLGVPADTAEDAVQDVFFVAHRRLGEFEGRSSIKTWLFGIIANVASNHRRSLHRKSPAQQLGEAVELDTVACERAGPHEAAERAEAVRRLEAVLEQLDIDKRAVFVLSELEQMSMPEIADALGVNVNTAYARLRAARKAFNHAVALQLARQERRAR